jgi:DNA-binding response OmpR family regulator
VSVIKDGLLDAVGRHAPDAAVLDLELPSTEGVASLLELRDDRLHTGLPILVLTHDGLNDKERDIVDELATVHARREESSSALVHLLEAVFPAVAVPDSTE